MLVYYSRFFFKKKYHISNLLSYPIFIYWALYPYIISNDFFRIPYLDQIFGVLAILVAIINITLFKGRMYINRYEILIFLIIGSSWIYMEYAAPYYTALTNILYIFLLTFSFYNTSLMRDSNIIGEILIKNSVILSLLAIIEFLIFNTRVSVTLYNPNYLGIYIVFGFVILVFYKIKFRLLLALVILIAILLTESDSIIVGLIFPIAILLIYKLKLKSMFKILLPTTLFLFYLGIIFALSQSILANKSYFDFLAEIVLLKSDSLRFDIWRIAVDMFWDNPILGIGYNQFQTHIINIAPQYPMVSIRKEGFVTHNDFIRILAELGLIGISAFIIYIFKSIDLANKGLNINLRMTIISLILILLFFSYTHNNINSFLFWVTIAFPVYKKI